MLTKEDYMKLPKERLAELLVERETVSTPIVLPYSQAPLLCDGEHCTNPFRDCINCPRPNDSSGIITTTNTTGTTIEQCDKD